MKPLNLGHLLLLLLLVACRKDKVDDVNPLIPPGDGHDHGAPVENTASVEGYSDKVAYYPGDSVRLMISTATDSLVSIALYRYGLTDELIFNAEDIPAKRQDYFKYSYSWGCVWDTTYSFYLDENLRSGYYCAVVKNSAANTEYITFIVKEPREPVTKSKVLVVASTNTWQAYNLWGGGSFYRYHHNDLGEDIRHSVIVSFRRPNKADTPRGDKGHLVNAEMHLIRWLEQKGIDYAVASDRDIHGASYQFEDRKVVMLHAHPEYYTVEMLTNLEQFNLDGGHIMYLGANGLYWKVTLSDDDQIECRKDGDTHKYGEGTGGLWSEKGRSPALLVGSHYSGDGYGTYHPYEVLNETHWVFEGTGLENGDVFGENCLNGEGASGHETDKRTVDTPEDFITLAKGTNPDNGGAELLIRESSGRGIVYSVGSITYTGSLIVDPLVDSITTTVLERCLQ